MRHAVIAMRTVAAEITVISAVEAVPKCFSITEVIKTLGGNPRSGGVFKLVSKRIKEFGLDTSHFKFSRGRSGCNKLSPKKIFSRKYSSAVVLRRALLETGVNYECEICKTQT